MTIEKIIKELEIERLNYLAKANLYSKKCNDSGDNIEFSSALALNEYYNGQAMGIKTALCWLKYLDNKNKD